MVLKHWLIVICLLPLVATAQVPEEDLWLEEYGNEATAGAMSDYLMQLVLEPVNVNDSLAVRELPMVTPFQIKALRNYIILHGQLLSLDELYFVPGFDSVTVGLIRPFLKAEPYMKDKKWQWWNGRHTVVTGVGSTIERAAGYGNGRYEGDALHANFCYNYNYADRLSMRLAYDKDPTEVWGRNNYIGYHLMVSDVGKIEKFIVGRYNLQFGQGLTVWSGLQPFNITGYSTYRYGRGVRPASTFYEEGYQQGAAVTVDMGRGVHVTSFLSRDSNETLVGGRVEYRRGTLQIGTTASYSALDDSIYFRSYAYNYNRYRGTRLLNVGVDGVWQWRKLLFYGEVAADQDRAVAAIAGLDVLVGGDNRFGLSWRNYDNKYHNLHAEGYGIGSTQGEQGIAFNAHTKLPFGIDALMSLDLHRFPSLRYGCYSPSEGAWLRVQAKRRFGSNANVKLQYAYRRKERNIPNIDSTLYLGEQTLRQQLQANVQYAAGRWSFDTRATGVLFDSESGGMQRGVLMAQTAKYTSFRLQGSAGVAWFDVSDYYARIYYSESNLQYAWSMPALNGKGLRGHLLVKYAIGWNITLAAKYTVTYYHGQESVGSGDARTEGPVRQTLFLQLRWNH